MAKDKIAGTMSTNIGVNTTDAVKGIDTLKSSVKDSTNAWKQMESQMKQSGDTLGASKAKYEGISDSVDKQKNVLERLKKEQSEVNRSTSDGEKAYQKYATQVTQAESKLTSLNGQQDKARQAYDYQKSGLAKLNEEVQHSNKLTDERVKKLEAEGKTDEAKKARIDGLTKAQDKYSKMLNIQKGELEKLGASGDKNSKSYKLQEIRVAEMSTKVSEATRDIRRLNNTEVKPKTNGINHVKSQLSSLNNSISKTQGMFKSIFLGNIVANGVTNALSDVKNKFTGALGAGVEYNKQIEALSISMDNFTNGDQKLNDSLVGNIKKLREESGYSVDTLSLLTKKTYGLAGSVEGAKSLSDAFVNLGRATGKSDDAMQNIITKFTQMNASGEITSGSITKMEKTLPGFAKSMTTTLGVSRDQLNELAKSGKLSMSDLSKTIEAMSKAKPHGLDNYLTSFNGFSDHLQEKYKSLSGKITESFFKTNNNFLKTMSKSLDGDETEKSFGKIGDSANKALSSIVKSFSSVFSGTKNPVADLATGLANQIERLGNFISDHANDIKNFFVMIKEVGGVAFKLIGDALKVAIPWLEKFGKFASEHPETVKKLAIAIIGFNVALKGSLLALKGVEKFKALIGIIKGIGLAFKTVGVFLMANPFVAIIAGIAALGVGLFQLYKHNEKFRKFVDGIVKAVKDFSKDAIEWFKKTWDSISKGFSKFTKSVSKGFKSFIDGIVKPVQKFSKDIAKFFGDAWESVTKGFDKFGKSVSKGFKTVIDGIVKIAKGFGKALIIAIALPVGIAMTITKPLVEPLKKIFSELTKWIKKTWETVTKFLSSVWKPIQKTWNSTLSSVSKTTKSTFTGIFKFLRDIWSNITKTISNSFKFILNIVRTSLNAVYNVFVNIWNGIVKFFTPIIKWLSTVISNTITGIRDTWNNIWNSISTFFSNLWNGLIKTGKTQIDLLKNTLSGPLEKIRDFFSGIWDGVSGGFSKMWDSMKGFAKNGINGIIDVVNTGIGGINTVIHTFGGSKEAISPVKKFANGTKGAPKGMGLINDAPGEHYQEAVIDNSGQMHVLEGRNRLVNFQGGETVVPAHAIPKFESGTNGWLESIGGWFKDKWDGLKEMIAHPVESLSKLMTRAVSGITGSPLVTSLAPALGNGFVNGIVSPIKNLLGSLKKKHDDENDSPSGSGVQRWSDQVRKALEMNGLSTSDDMVNRVLRQIASESSGNEKAVQGDIGDINNITGDLAKGLMQTISATFNAYKFPGHGDIFNGYDNLLAALNYAKNRYGSGLSFLGQGHGYENGGLITKHGLYEVGEGNKPEMIIPLSVDKNARANQLLAEANQRINGSGGSFSGSQTDITPILAVLNKIYSAIDDLKKSPIPAYVNLDGRIVSQGLAPYMNQEINTYTKHQGRIGGNL
ncbi:tape measure protein [Lactococcus piscium]|uniref:tape measure protein n=1 Tax=Pseudolactococcus paracarnosus TaxID=2749962 RepID=UPI001FBA50FE|nr:tape measure protein [Lactococcus paracarnosus]MCJ1993805.1 tape measure protein [Lactococcus paracarnosus]